MSTPEPADLLSPPATPESRELRDNLAMLLLTTPLPRWQATIATMGEAYFKAACEELPRVDRRYIELWTERLKLDVLRRARVLLDQTAGRQGSA